MRILYADADTVFSNRITDIFSKQGCDVDTVCNSADCMSFADFDVYDVIIIDSSICSDDCSTVKMLRGSKNSTPLMYIGSARSVEDTVCALDCGADDYMCKPFAPAEFAARIRALARRKHTVLEFSTMSYRDLTLDLNSNELLCGVKVIRLGVKEFQILRLLISSGNHVVAKERLAEKVWGINSGTEYNNVEVYISFIRKKLKKINSQVTINTLRNNGYCLGIK